MNSLQKEASLVRTGIVYGALAYGTWGFLTIYWKLLSWMPNVEVIAHRAIWTVVFLLPFVLVMGGGREFWLVLKKPRLLVSLGICAALIASNWLAFVWAVTQNHVIQVSLGYFINPLFSVLLGVLVMRERLRPWQWCAVALAACGVLWLVVSLKIIPWIALFLASTFAVYGLLRKYIPVSATVGLTIETLWVFPIAVGYLFWVGLPQAQANWWSHGTLGALAVVLTGVATAIPLLWFAKAAQRLPLSTLGFLQYLAPSIQLVLGVFFYQEPFSTQHLIAFSFIWSAIAVFSLDSWRQAQQKKRS